MNNGNIRIKAGRLAYKMIRDGGFTLDTIATYFGPAGGPRWLVSSGFDLTLLKKGLLGRKKPLWLVGASAGAWRFAAWLQPEAEKSYLAFMNAYITAIYKRGDSPRIILKKLVEIVDSYIEEDGLPFALSNKQYRLAILTTRMKNIAISDSSWSQKAGFLLIFLANALNPSFVHRFAERVVFYYGPKPPDFCFQKEFRGRFFPLNPINFKSAVLASGAIPLVVAGVRNIFGAPDGIYRDGGLIDYNISQDYRTKNIGLTLFFHHQERVIPGWMDKNFKKRRPSDALLESVLMVYPSEEFVKKLPDGRIPDRSDFDTFIDDPKTRIANWRKTTELAAPLGEEFLELVESNKMKDLIEEF
jgi:hypothetical protein